MVQLSSCLQLITISRYVLSATPEINLWFGLFPFRSPLLRKSIFLSLPLGTQMFQFPRSTLLQLCIHYRIHGVNPCEFPHSEIFGSLAMCAYPKLIAACRVLHRLLMPRHSPCALCSLTFACLLFPITSSILYFIRSRTKVLLAHKILHLLVLENTNLRNFQKSCFNVN